MKRGMIESWLRILLLQASWNYERLVGVGLAFSSEPLLRDLPGGKEGERYRTAMSRASQHFNGHPYLMGLAVGALTRTEHDEVPTETIQRLRTALAGPLGSVGDKLIWAGLLPACSAVALVLAVWISPVAAVVGFLVLYNLGHFALRLWGLSAGWSSGLRVAQRLGSPALKRGLRLAGPAAALCVGFALPIVAKWLLRHLDGHELIACGVILSVGFILSRWLWPTLGGNRFGLAAVVVALVLGVL
ncbi:MAG: PTS system mannose/fructose/sorbose family transporter subunit IID [Gemmatimonadota bacterium]|nr:MAG: PTS system mannose/fructose/sorbose family transporter subunit IID [Gemmatimonadota bacterium]